MPFATADDVLAGWRALWERLPLPKLVTGGLHRERPPQGPEATPPYAVVKVVGGDRVEITGGAYWQPYTVTVEVRSIEGAADSSPIAENLYAFDWTHDLFVSHAQVIWVKPNAEAAEFDKDTYQAKDVVFQRMAWEVMCGQGSEVEPGDWFGWWLLGG